MKLLPLALLLALATSLHAAEEASAPELRVTRSGEQTQIAFTLQKATDVEVAIVDAKSRIVRHLAAGVLGGKNPPPAPLHKGLSQKLTWDGKDDLGQPAKGGPFRVRLRTGTTVQLGRFLGGSPYTGSLVGLPYRAPVNGLVVDDQGKLYVKLMSSVGSHGNYGMWPWHLRQLDRQGKYQKTLLPYPPSTPPARASGFRLLPTPDGRLTPANHTSLYPVFAVLGDDILPRLSDGRIVFVNTPRRQLSFLSLDGTNRLTTIPMWSDAAKLKSPTWLDTQVALSPDGRYAYYSNVAGTAYDGKRPEDIDPSWPQGRIYRHDLKNPEIDPRPFFDLALPDWEKKPYWMPSAWDKKTAAAGIDTDAKGNILLCDLVNHNVVEISPEGKLLSTTPVPWPDRVLVSRKTGTLYVISRKVSRGALPPATLYAITGRGEEAKVVAQLPLKGTIGGAFTLDESGDQPVLWLAGKGEIRAPDQDRLLRVEHRDTKLVVTDDAILNRDKDAIGFVGYMDVDSEADLVYVTGSKEKVWRYDGNTGRGELLPIKAVDVAIGPRGDIYAWGTGSYDGPIARYRRDLEPSPLPSTGSHTFGKLTGRAGRGFSVCGLDVDLRGRVHATVGSNDCHVRVYDADGKPVSYPRRAKGDAPAAITGVTGYGGSIRTDSEGNIYLLQAGLPEDHQPPPGYEKDEAYHNAVGTIHKFPPAGGEIETRTGRVTRVHNAVGSYAGCGPVSRWNAAGACACTKPRFDVDGFGRLYIPNGITFSVSVRDNADNEIVRFGAYGNFDCQGPGSSEPEPAIPLGWPITAGASDRHIYVGDALNHRVVCVDRRFATERVIPIPD